MFRKKTYEEGETKKRSSIWPALSKSLAAAVIFFSGWAIGSGFIDIGPDAVFKKSVSQDLPADLDYSDVEALYDSLKVNFDGQLKRDELLDGLKSGLAEATGDPYTEYLNSQEATEFEEQLNGTFTGIGAELTKDPETNSVTIVSPISGFPAERAGLKPKDILTEIDGKSAYDITVSEAVKQIRGPEGTPVRLKVIRGGNQELTFDIIREKITIPSVETKTLDGNIGYIKISRFAEDTTQLVREAAEKFKQQNVQGLIVDVRNNPGGLLDVSIAVSSLWLDDKEVLSERRGGEVIKTFRSTGDPILQGIPTVVLINEGSASASEILAGALRDNEAATLVGVKSFGKGSVQQLINFKDGSQLKVTIARWYTPGGKNIDKEGISPDKEVKISDEDTKNDRDPQLDAAIERLKN